jgi:hypothetical protein
MASCNAVASSRGAHPNIAVFIGGQYHRQGLRVSRRDHSVRHGGREAVDPNWLGLGTAIAFEQETRPIKRPTRRPTQESALPFKALICMRAFDRKLGTGAFHPAQIRTSDMLEMSCSNNRKNRVSYQPACDFDSARGGGRTRIE